jgi:hypothetical protein
MMSDGELRLISGDAYELEGEETVVREGELVVWCLGELPQEEPAWLENEESVGYKREWEETNG